jgi:hypothetical protein
MPMDKAALEAAARQKAYEDRITELRRQSAEKTRKSLAETKADIDEHGKKFEEAHASFVKIVEEHQRLMGTESFSTLVMQMRPTLEAFSKMSAEMQMYLLAKVHHAISSNFNYQSSPGWVLEMFNEGWIQLQAKLEKEMGLTGNDLPPVFVPYLADVDDQGVLSVNLNVPNTQMTEDDRQKFVTDYQADFNTTITNWINGSRNLDGEAMRIEHTPDGQKIRLPDGVAPDGSAVVRYMGKEEFLEFRGRVLQPELERHFTVDFVPEAPRNMGP